MSVTRRCRADQLKLSEAAPKRSLVAQAGSGAAGFKEFREHFDQCHLPDSGDYLSALWIARYLPSGNERKRVLPIGTGATATAGVLTKSRQPQSMKFINFAYQFAPSPTKKVLLGMAGRFNQVGNGSSCDPVERLFKFILGFFLPADTF
jgi:hypothetical protein